LGGLLVIAVANENSKINFTERLLKFSLMGEKQNLDISLNEG
jgi:hypothetical protein